MRRIGLAAAMVLGLGCAPTGDHAWEIHTGIAAPRLRQTEAPPIRSPTLPSLCRGEPERSIALEEVDVLLLEEEGRPKPADDLPLELDLHADVRSLRVSLINRGREREYFCGNIPLDERTGLLVTDRDGNEIRSIPCTGHRDVVGCPGSGFETEAVSLAPGQRVPLRTYSLHRVDEDWVTIYADGTLACWVVPAEGTEIRARLNPFPRGCDDRKESLREHTPKRRAPGPSGDGQYYVRPPTREILDRLRFARPRTSNAVRLHPAELPYDGPGARRAARRDEPAPREGR